MAANRDPQNIYWEAILISIGCAVLALLGISFLDWLLENPSGKHWWLILVYGILNALIPIATVAFLFEVFIRRKLHREFVQEMRDLFSEDPSLARSLNEETRKKRVRNVLIAQLGEEGGLAVYSALAERYLTGTSPLRWNETLEVIIGDLTEDIEISLPDSDGKKVILSKDKYHRVSVNISYEGIFDDKHRSVGCILVEDSEELNLWFKRDDCFLRDVVCLSETDRSAIVDLLQAQRTKADPTATSRKRSTERDKIEAVSKLFSVNVSIDDKPFDVQRIKLSQSGKSIELELKNSGKINKGTRVRYEMKQVSILAKKVKNYPVIFGEPCQNPSVSFHYPAKDIANVRESTFLTGRSPFEPELLKNPEARFLKVSVPQSRGPLWVFPNSGVVFTWESVQS